jgi:lipopolysaccharide export system protein LptC
MEMDTRRWVLLVVLALVLVGLVAFARGPEHHHGSQQVGAHADGAAPVVAAA